MEGLLGAVVFGALSVCPFIRACTALIPMPVQYGLAALLAVAMFCDCWSAVRSLSNFQKKLEAAARLRFERKALAAEKRHESADALQKRREELAQRVSRQQKRISAALSKSRQHRTKSD